MIQVTKLDGSKLFVNEMNIQWIEQLPDTAITFLGGARVIVRDTPEELVRRCHLIRQGATQTADSHNPSESSVSPSSKS